MDPTGAQPPPPSAPPPPGPLPPDPPPPDPPPPEPPASAGPTSTPQRSAPRPPLRRSRSDRILFGVCGGLAEHLGVDPTLVRIGAVAIVAFGGVGILAYAAAVLLIPEEGNDEPMLRARGPRWLRAAGIVLLVLAVAGGLRSLFGPASPWFPVPVVLAGAVLLWVGAGRRELRGIASGAPAARVGAIALGVALLLGGMVGVLDAAGAFHLSAPALLASLVIVAGAVLAVSSIWGRPRTLLAAGVLLLAAASLATAADLDLSGGVGRHVYSLNGDAAARYRLGVGDLALDLRGAHPSGGAGQVDARVGVGRLLIVVPRGALTTVDHASGTGDARRTGGVDVTREVVMTDSSGRITVHAHVGLGEIEVAPRDPGAKVEA